MAAKDLGGGRRVPRVAQPPRSFAAMRFVLRNDLRLRMTPSVGALPNLAPG
jgi:hypothetical protein